MKSPKASSLTVATQWSILVPSASVPPSTGKPGLWRRKSSVGAVDAQGNLLVHPMVSCIVRPLLDPADTFHTRHGLMSAFLAGLNLQTGERVHGRALLVVKKSAEQPLPIYRRMKTSLIMITF